MLIWCLDPRDCTSTTPWIAFLIAIWLLTLVMIKTNDKMSKKWNKWIKVGATWARIRASEARLTVCVTCYFSRNIIKYTCFKVFFTTKWDIKKWILYVVFVTMCMNAAKEPIFIYRWYIYFTFSPIYFLSIFLTWHKILAKKLNKFCTLVQLWYVIISMVCFYSLTVLAILRA